MKSVWGALLFFLVSCMPEVIYSEVSLDFFIDKWWVLDENPLFSDEACFLLNSDDERMYIRFLGYVEYPEGTWSIEDDHILLEDVYGYDVTIWAYGTCGDYDILASGASIVQESKLYECEF
jgi:hypothetical protein